MPIQCVFKSAPISCLMYFVASFDSRASTKNYSKQILLGLFFCGIGDICLVLRPLGFFLPGVAAFGLGHIAYTVGFGFRPLRPIILLPFLVYFPVFNNFIYPSLSGALVIAVPIYSVLITVMMWRAVVVSLETQSMYTAVGSILFGISDTILAVSNFVTPLYMSDYSIMVTYYLAQCGIAISTVNFNSALPKPSMHIQ